MFKVRFAIVLLAAIAVTGVPSVSMAQQRLSAFKKQGSSSRSSVLRQSTSTGSGQVSGRLGKLSTPGQSSTSSSKFKKLGTQRTVSNSDAAKQFSNRTLDGVKSSLKSNARLRENPSGQAKNKSLVKGIAGSSDLSKWVNSDVKLNGNRMGNLSTLKQLNPADLGRARNAGWIQGPGSVQGLKDLASRIQDRKITSGSLKQIDKQQLSQVLKFGHASTNGVQKQAILAAAKQHCGVGAPCHWWFDVICGVHWRHHGCCWDYWCYPVYWKCWTPCNWRVVYCPTIHVAYYFGVEGVMIPDTAAFGIQAVQPGSPAERVGLRPGMMIVAVNGQAMTSESVMADAIQRSGGRLDLHVLAEGGEQPVPVTVILDVVRRSAY